MTDLGPNGGSGHDPDVLAAKLCDEIEAFLAREGMSHEAFTERAGLRSRQHLEQILAHGRKPGYRMEVPTAEKLAAAIGKRLTLEPNPPDETG